MPSEIALRGRSIPRQVTAPKKEVKVEEAEAEGSRTEARDAIARRAPTGRPRRLGGTPRTWTEGSALDRRITSGRTGLRAGTTAREPRGATASELVFLLNSHDTFHNTVYIAQHSLHFTTQSSHHPHLRILAVLLDHVGGHLVQVREGLDGDPFALPVRLNLLNVDDGAAARRHRRA